MLPEDLRGEYAPLLAEGGPEEAELHALLKAADKLSALIKCLQERRAGNLEFLQAEKTLRRSVEDMHLPEVDVFLREFLPAFCLTLDELEGEQSGEKRERER